SEERRTRSRKRRPPPLPWLPAGIVAAALVLVAVAGALMLPRLLRSKTADRDAPGKRVLLVLPYRQFWYPDYEAVTAEMKKAGVTVVVASSQPGEAIAAG